MTAKSILKNALADEIKPLRDKVAGSIRDLIIEGKLKPGERLTEPEVARLMGISRTPLREAFFLLESEGFLVVNPRRGVVVSEISLKDAEDTYTLEGTLEALAAKLSYRSFTQSQIKELEKLNNKMALISESEKKDYKLFLELNAKFHQMLYENCGNDKLTKLIKSYRNQTLRYNYIYLSLLSHLKESVAEHTKIITAIKKKNEKLIMQYISDHAESAGKAVHKYMKNK